MNPATTSPITDARPTLPAQFFSETFAVGSQNTVSYINSLIKESINTGASDILFEPQSDAVRLRVRLDGVLYELTTIAPILYAPIASRIKVMANLDPAEKRKVQEGQITVTSESRGANLRIEIVQTVYDEMIVIRIHEKRTIVMDLATLGFNEQALTDYQKMIDSKSGLVIVCGPTGCGKTTTLYSTISRMNKSQKYNVLTIEDPVEYQLPGINQMQTRSDQGFSFAEGLRTILRLSPDIIVVGEIRDRETAEITVESGLTGQLVFSSLHSPDAAGVLYRLLDLGIEPYVLNSALVGIVAQRLVRRNCSKCLQPYTSSPDEVEMFQKIIGRQPKQLQKSKGCQACGFLGYVGRIGIYEVLTYTAKLRDWVRHGLSEDEMRTNLINEGFITLIKDGLLKSELGITTISEVMRASLRVY